MSTTTELEAGEQLDAFRVVRRLGAGGFAAVYEAVDERTGTHVVLKVPDVNLLGDPQTYERFRREVAISKRLDHPNIQRSIDTSEKHTQPYLVLEYVEGEPLRDHVRGHLPLDPDVAVGYARQLAGALAHAHGHGVAHRDLKPENVLVTADEQLKLIDFGIALLEGARRVTWRWVNNAVGTPDYMSPEQIQGKRGDERSDIYALGTMLYELLSGKVPFHGDNALAVMQQVVTTRPVPVDSRNHRVPRPLAAVVHKAMRKDPALRYQNAEALLHDLEHLDEVDLEVFAAEPEDAGAGTRGVMSDRQMLLLGAGVALGLLVLSAIIVAVVALASRH